MAVTVFDCEYCGYTWVLYIAQALCSVYTHVATTFSLTAFHFMNDMVISAKLYMIIYITFLSKSTVSKSNFVLVTAHLHDATEVLWSYFSSEKSCKQVQLLQEFLRTCSCCWGKQVREREERIDKHVYLYSRDVIVVHLRSLTRNIHRFFTSTGRRKWKETSYVAWFIYF